VLFGGTSESAPLTAGAGALVIEAHRKIHNGATPSPALVNRS
jgi:subtilase family serine protease